MLKKLLISAILFMAYAMPLQAQHFSFELSYQSFRPFIHFHLDYESQSYHHDYESAYLKGYMDGVIDEYYYHHRFNELVYDSRIYEAGYRDGLRDRELLIRLRGHGWYHRHRFTYNDYYEPAYSVRIWLDGLSLAFLQAPTYRLPKRWKHRAHPHVITYRKWIAGNRHHKKYDRYRSAVRIGKNHSSRNRLYERQAVKPSHRFGKKHLNRGDRYSDKRYRENRGKGVFKNKRVERSRNKVKQRKAVGKNNSSRRSRGAVKEQKRQTRKRGTVKRSRGGSKKEKSNRGRKRGKRNRGGN